jgi:NAD(P)H-hydrate epimerase
MAGMKSCLPFDNQIHRVMSRQEVRDYDAWAIKQMGIPGTTLMENAGRSAAVVAMVMLGGQAHPAVSVFCGAGNNGGDGFVIARHLANHGVEVQIILCAGREKIQGDARTNFVTCEKMGIAMVDLDMTEGKIHWQVQTLCRQSTLIVDAIFGTGFKGELSSPFAALISCINALHVLILSVDIPSGMDCDTGQPLPVCIEAAATVSFVAAKKGFFQQGQLQPAIGQLYIASIGITAKSN